MDQLIRWGRDALLLAAAAGVPVVALWGVLVWARTRKVGRRAAIKIAALDAGLVFSLAAIAIIGLRPGWGETGEWVQWNFVPFRDLAVSLDQPSWAQQIAITNLIGNILLFLPWGFMLTLRFPRTGWAMVLVSTAALSLAVEIGQAITATGRLSDVTDVLMNTVGGAVGFAIGRWAVTKLPGLRVTGDDARDLRRDRELR